MILPSDWKNFFVIILSKETTKMSDSEDSNDDDFEDCMDMNLNDEWYQNNVHESDEKVALIEHLLSIFEWINGSYKPYLILQHVPLSSCKWLIQVSRALRFNYGWKMQKCIEKRCSGQNCSYWINITQNSPKNYHDHASEEERITFGFKPYDSYFPCPSCGHDNYVDDETLFQNAVDRTEYDFRFSNQHSTYEREFVLFWPYTDPPRLNHYQFWKGFRDSTRSILFCFWISIKFTKRVCLSQIQFCRCRLYFKSDCHSYR